MSYLTDHQKLHSFFIDQFGNIKKYVQPELNFVEEIQEEEMVDNNGVIFL
jgi:hypothetical protein